MGKEFQGEPVLPVGVAQGEEIATVGGIRIADKDVEPLEVALDRVEELRNGVGIAQVGDLARAGPSSLQFEGRMASSRRCLPTCWCRSILPTIEHGARFDIVPEWPLPADSRQR